MKKKNPAAGAPMSIRLAEDLKRDLESAALKLKMDTHQVMRLAMEVGLEHFTRIHHDLAACVVDRIADSAKNTGQSHAKSSKTRVSATANLQDSTPECPPIPVATADSTSTIPTNPPTPKTANIVRLPPPPALATAGRWSLNESPTPPPTEQRNETTYQKPPRKKNG